MDTKLRQLQLIELDILKEFVRICEKHSLQYYLIGGTLLGAVRHKGFIPWDDDIDVAMPRKDYEKFAVISKSELQPEYFYQNSTTDSGYFLTYAKLRRNNSFFYEERFINSHFHKGIFIDIFPLDFCPKPGILCHLFFNVLAVMNYRGQIDSGESYVPYREWSGKLGYSVLRLFNTHQLIRARRTIISIFSWISDDKFLASYSGAYGYSKEIFPAEWFGTGRALVFEGQNFSVPFETEQELTQVYGEYHSLPPQSEQKTHCNLERCILYSETKETAQSIHLT